MNNPLTKSRSYLGGLKGKLIGQNSNNSEESINTGILYHPDIYYSEIPNTSSMGKEVIGVEPTRKKLELIWAKDIYKSKVGFVESLWGDFFYPESIHLLSGTPGCGKSTFLYNFAYNASNGDDFLNVPFAKPLKVLHFDLETPRILRKVKIDRISNGFPPDGWCFCESLDFMRDISELAKLVNRHHFNLVIVDTINQAFKTQREEDNAEANRHMQAVQSLVKSTRCSVILVHHIGKNETGVKVYKSRGATARPAGSDVVINLENKNKDRICLELVKDKWLGKNSKLFLRKVGEDKFETIKEAKPENITELYKAMDAIRELIKDKPMGNKEITIEMKNKSISSATTGRALKALLEWGKVIKPKRGLYMLKQ